jgi:AraC-like DNA-binding protein
MSATGVGAYDSARWVNPPPRTCATSLANGVQLVWIAPNDAGPLSWEAEVPAAPSNLLIWRSGSRSPVEAVIGGRRDPGAGRAGRNGYVIPAGLPTRWAAQRVVPGTSLHVHLPPRWLAEIAEVRTGEELLLAPRFGLEAQRLEPLLERLLGAWRDDAPATRAALEHWSLLLALRVVPRRPPPHEGRLDGAALARLREFLRANLHRDIGLTDMARLVDMPPRAFAAAHKATTGEAPAAHLARMRLEHARTLHQHARLSLADIALLAGYRSAAQLRSALSRSIGEGRA